MMTRDISCDRMTYICMVESDSNYRQLSTQYHTTVRGKACALERNHARGGEGRGRERGKTQRETKPSLGLTLKQWAISMCTQKILLRNNYSRMASRTRRGHKICDCATARRLHSSTSFKSDFRSKGAMPYGRWRQKSVENMENTND